MKRKQILGFYKEELMLSLEIAYRALAYKDVSDRLADDLDVSDDVMHELYLKLEKGLNKDE